MKKMYTSNHKNVITCYDFELKFKDFLSYILPINFMLHEKMVSANDFKIDNVNEFKQIFNSFFQNWLRENFNYDLDFCVVNVDFFILKKRTTDERFDELFANYHFFKKLDSAADSFYIYDISIDEENRVREIINKKPLLNND